MEEYSVMSQEKHVLHEILSDYKMTTSYLIPDIAILFHLITSLHLKTTMQTLYVVIVYCLI